MSLITRTPVLWNLFALAFVMPGFFAAFAPSVGGQYLDMLDKPEVIRATFAAMTPEQKSAHFWVTVLVDTAFPIAFGLLFAGLAWRFFGKYGPLAAIPGFAVLIVDLTENTIQALALSGAADALDAKAWVTPLKMGLFYLAAVIALVALGIAMFRMVTKKKA
ncbi:MAG: hypothetical protein ACK4HR_02920 [Hyphomonas sp.]|jgi:hypothetical protein